MADDEFWNKMRNQPKPKKVLEADAFYLTDARGKVRASLEIQDDGRIGLALFDQNGKSRLIVGMQGNGNPHVTLFDKSVTPRAGMILGDEGSGLLAILDKHRKLECSVPGLPDTKALHQLSKMKTKGVH